MSTNRKFLVGVLLFAMLGGVLNIIGLRVSENPVSFFMILGIALLIDLNASWK